MLVELDEEFTKCSICVAKFSSDIDNKDPEIRKHLPVLSSSQRCDHWFCHGCVLREQLRVAEENNGRIPKWIKCMHCREKTSFNPAEPKYHRLLIDLLGRAQKYAAAQMKNENEGMNADADAQLVSERATSIKIKRESDIDDDEEKHEAKRSKLISPSLPLVRVKEEPTPEPPPLPGARPFIHAASRPRLIPAAALLPNPNTTPSPMNAPSVPPRESYSASSSCPSNHQAPPDGYTNPQGMHGIAQQTEALESSLKHREFIKALNTLILQKQKSN